MGLIRYLDDFLDGVFRCDLRIYRDGFEVGSDSVYVVESASVPGSGYRCFQ